MYREKKGDLITLTLEGNFDVIAHGCNCFCTMSAGIAPQMGKTFGCDKYALEDKKYKGNINKLGQIDYVIGWTFKYKYVSKENMKLLFFDHNNVVKKFYGKTLVVVNAYTQYYYGKNHKDGIENPLDYEALRLCMRKINHTFKGKHIGLPKIGCGLAGGIWDIDEAIITEKNNDKIKSLLNKKLKGFKDVKTIIQEELKGCNVTVVIL